MCFFTPFSIVFALGYPVSVIRFVLVFSFLLHIYGCDCRFQSSTLTCVDARWSCLHLILGLLSLLLVRASEHGTYCSTRFLPSSFPFSSTFISTLPRSTAYSLYDTIHVGTRHIRLRSLQISSSSRPSWRAGGEYSHGRIWCSTSTDVS